MGLSGVGATLLQLYMIGIVRFLGVLSSKRKIFFGFSLIGGMWLSERSWDIKQMLTVRGLNTEKVVKEFFFLISLESFKLVLSSPLFLLSTSSFGKS
jgi:hypothetical protein